MIKNFDEIKDQLKELSGIINSFKSEAVQVRLVELIFAAVDGEEIDEVDQESGQKKPKRPRRKTSNSRNSPTTTDPRPTRAVGRPGSKTTMQRLYNEGFFKKPRAIGQIVEHCETNLALKYKQSDFSGTLARYTRDGKLKRAKNKDNQYEYTQA